MTEKIQDPIQSNQQADLAPSLPQIDELPLMTDLSMISELPIVTELPQITEEDENESGEPKTEVPVLSENMLALVDDYKQRGWIILKDGCPDCDIPLMRNPDATSQVCVSCEILPPVDIEDVQGKLEKPTPQTESKESEKKDQEVTPYRNSVSAPLVVYRTSLVLNSSPPPSPEIERPRSPPPKRMSVLDPIFDAIRRSYRSTTGKNSSGPSTTDFPKPPTRPSTPMPKTSPKSKSFLVMRPPRPITTSVISSPVTQPSPSVSPAPSVLSAPRILPRDKRRASQTISHQAAKSIDQSSTKSRTPPSSVIGSQDGIGNAPGPIPNNLSSRRERKGSPIDYSHAEVEKHSHSMSQKQTHDADDESESFDEFEDAEEEMVIRSTEQSEISNLMGQKIMQGWVMLQESCPNPTCVNIPLMRSREKIDYCVVCQNYYYQKDNDTHHVHLGKYPTIPQSNSSLPSRHRRTPSHASTISHFQNTPTISRVNSPTPPSHSQFSSQSKHNYGRASVLPPPIPAPPSFGLSGQQMMSDEDDIDPPVGAEELKRNMSLIRRKKKNFTSGSLPPPPPGYPTLNGSTRLSRYNPQQEERTILPEIQLMVSASQKTMATLVSKLDVYRLALEVTENPSESQALTLQIKGLLECLKACRETMN